MTKPPLVLTSTQIEAMRRVRDRGPLAWCQGSGRGGGSIMRMFDRLVAHGYVSGPPYAVTEKGMAVLAAVKQK